MEQFIQTLIKRLQTEVEALQYVDEDWGQMDFWLTADNKPNRHPVKYPCVLIDIDNVQYTDNSQLQQSGRMRVNIRYFALRLSNSSSGAPSEQKQNNNKLWLDLQNINKALHGWRPASNYHRMQREQLNRHKRDDGVRAYQFSYSVSFIDDSATKKTVQTPYNQVEINTSK